MENVPSEVLKHILTTFPTYREQCLLANVCRRWHTMVRIDSGQTCKKMADIAARLYQIEVDPNSCYDSVEHLEIYSLLCDPEYRSMFIDPQLRHTRYRIIYISHDYYCFVSDRCIIPGPNPYHRIYRQLHDILTLLYKKIDTELILSDRSFAIDRYWSKVRHANSTPSDLSHDQYCAIFGAC